MYSSQKLHLVTGGAGFVGSTLVRRLLSDCARVRVVDNFSTGLFSNLEEVVSRIEIIEGDLSDPSVSRRAVEGVEYVFHQAEIPSVAYSMHYPGPTILSNFTATLNLLSACAKEHVPRVVFASSCAVYGDTTVLPSSEDDAENPASPYALAKMVGEKYLEMCSRIYRLSGVSLRYFNVFGPRQNPHLPYSGVISRFLLALAKGKMPVIYGDGQQSRDFVYVDDVVNANILAVKCESVSGISFNIGSGEGRSLDNVLHTLSSLSGKAITANYVQPRLGDVRHSLADIGRARELLGYQPQVGFEEGLRKTFAWVQNSGEAWGQRKRPSVPTTKDKQTRVRETSEVESILGALEKTQWNRKRAATLLEMSYKTLLLKILKYGLDK